MNTLLKKSLVPFFIVSFLIFAIVKLNEQTSILWKTNAPDVTFTTIKGEKIAMSALKGKVVLVSFWATDCASCIQEMPDLVNLYKQYKQSGFEVIAVAMRYDPPAQVLNYATQKSLPFPVMHDGFAEISNAFGHVNVTPTTFIFDKHGKQLQRTIGIIDFNKLDQLLNTQLNNKKDFE